MTAVLYLALGDLGAAVRLDHQRVAAVGLFGQLVFEQFGGVGRAGARQGQVVVGLAARACPAMTSATAAISQAAIVG